MVVQEEKKSSRLKREAVEAVAVVGVLNVRNFCRKYTAVAASPGELQAARLCEEEVVCRRSSSSSLDAASVDGDCIAASAEQRSKGSKAIYVVAAAHYTAHTEGKGRS